MLPLLLPLMLLADAGLNGHEATNPLYRELLTTGLPVGPGQAAPLPPPFVPDGLDTGGQRRAIEALLAGNYSWAEFTRPSVVAPYILRIADVTPSDPAAPTRRVDVAFLVHGDFTATEDEAFLERLLGVGREGGTGRTLSREDVAKRGIESEPGLENRESFGRVEFDFLDRVRLGVTGRAIWSRTGESVVAAARIDPRFRDDPDFPNRWRPLSKSRGELTAGEPRPYDTAGLYLKVTRLAEPKGSVFVEQHILFAEPVGWFDGANLLRSKLPPVVQNNVRAARREWAKK